MNDAFYQHTKKTIADMPIEVLEQKLKDAGFVVTRKVPAEIQPLKKIANK